MASDPTHGEHPRCREAMDSMTGQLVRAGVDPKVAEKKAREAAIRHAREGRK